MSTPFFKKYDTEHHTCLLQNLKWIHSRFSFPHAFRGYLEPKSLVSHRTCSLCRTPKEIAASTAYTRNDTCLTQNCLVPDDCGQYHIASQFWNFTFLVPVADIEIYGRKHDLHQKPFKDVTQDLVDVVLQIHNDAKGGVELGKYRDSRIDEKLRKRYKLLKEDGMNGPPDQVIAHQTLLHFLGASICEECLALDAGKDAIVEVASVLNLLGNLCCKKDQFGDGLKRILVNRFQSPRLAANWKINYESKDKKTVDSVSESATSSERRPVRSSSRLRKRHRGPAEEEDVRSEDPEMIAKEGSKTAHITASEPDENPEHFEEILKPARTLKNPFAEKDLHHANGSDRDRDAEISDEHNGNPIFPTNRSKMSASNTNSQRNSQGKQSWLEDLEDFHACVDSTCRSLGRFTPSEFQGHFGFVEPMNYGYKSLEDLFVMRECVHEGGGVFIYKGITCPIQPSSANGNEVFEYPKIPPNVPLGRLIQYYSHVDGVMRQLKRFSISEFEEKFDPKAHENYGFCSVEHVLSFRGCQRTGEEFVFDEVTALQTKALSVTTYLNMEFSDFEFKRVFRRLFLTNNVTVHLAKRGFDSLRSLLKSLGGVEINKFGDDKGFVKYTLLTSRRESQGPSLTDVQATANTIPVPSDVVENDSNDSDIGILHEHIVTKKRSLVAGEQEATFDGDGTPILKKEKKCPEDSSRKPTETFAEEVSNADSNDVFCPDEEMTLKRKENPGGRQEHEKSSKDNTNPASEEANSVDEEEIEKEEGVVIEEADSTVESVPIPNDPSEANSVYERILNMGTPCGQLVEKQASEITAEMDQSIQNEGAMGGTGAASSSQQSEYSSVDSDDEALIDVMSYHNEFLNAVILGAMKKGVDPEDLGKKILDRIFVKNPEP